MFCPKYFVWKTYWLYSFKNGIKIFYSLGYMVFDWTELSNDLLSMSGPQFSIKNNHQWPTVCTCIICCLLPCINLYTTFVHEWNTTVYEYSSFIMNDIWQQHHLYNYAKSKPSPSKLIDKFLICWRHHSFVRNNRRFTTPTHCF